MKIKELKNAPQWLIDAVVRDEDVEIDEYGRVQWNSGEWLSGNFWDGNFWGGNFRGGDFCGGNFRGGNFWDGNFRGGDFCGGNFWGEAIKIAPMMIHGLRWAVVITDNVMQIGCQRHSHSAWRRFSKKAIAKMDSEASAVWEPNKVWILAACEQHAARAKAKGGAA